MSSTVEQIKSRLNIVDVVQSYIKLQKAGSNLKACCPFHQEKTPSFFVSPVRDSWHCFGCARGGDIFSFVIEIEGVDFVEALKILADMAGVEVQKINRKEENERIILLRLMDDARRFYQAKLKESAAAVEYLKDRGMKGETALAFNVGFAPDGWRNLYDHLKKKNYSEKEMEKTGLLIKSGKGYYDRFRGRIMFPLCDSLGRSIGFSGRIFGEEKPDSGGKYINTPQTVLYDKSRLLFAFDKAKNEIRKKDFCVLVEGQMDAVMSHQAGIANTVAVSGTALTQEHLKLIKRFTQNIIMSFDKDAAGLMAAKRGIKMALEEGFAVKAASAPLGKDPADAVKENPQSWIEAVSGAVDIIEFLINNHKGTKEMRESVLPFIAFLPNEMEMAKWVKMVATKLNIRDESVWLELKKIKPNKLAVGAVLETKSASSPKNRIDMLKDRTIGLALLKKETGDKNLKKQTEEIIKEENDFLSKITEEEKSKLMFDAELFFGDDADFSVEISKLKKETEKEKIKSELEEITWKIKNLESENGGLPENENENEKKLAEFLNNFHKLTKKLNEIK